ncbi:tRNA (adenosine(37)-N6)-threonylcarbamoyltransferase complex dimerization subunit type 1 TsaB [Falsiroseomonas selenitidurans]|uniref:tRNA (Adenosine(37)-N6)-threonylcarbamoyltransferase complex dimerization subunit type 1 TsaB n=1 Tax=Falsiroseomonas selenitidurans TaxID=2716335 RepID=A0ABX1E9I0_9PROT|nr:tRNA (adenosine(37)-N6)-threonylcarbamoyltransferase complex dimerization subunit type 1 TsaB [Falsiroseomonas selenitidurans]NKC33841.1 tRNA (adenosine(37)-N6)-threonylcarbamoyltransferase complex dimerization subunit type 1 TsaB [Falsiroseomonas selenitidurans]OYW10170.1 MAG: tRNA (adenosine(37)-N6)-threonylcarbamoyltransferase complex dimerization subunit type 1 TsaB [Rhodospirillales bacterium 12-71-4]
MKLLVLDGALARSSAAAFADGVLVAAAVVEGARGQPTALPPLAARMLAALGGLDAVAVVVGPGGFTGLRAAIALAEGLALGAGARLVGVTTGEALAAALPAALRARAVWSAVDTKRGRLVLERLAPGAWHVAEPPLPMAERDLPRPDGPVVLVGDAAPLAAARLLARGADAVLTDARLPLAACAGLVALRRLAGAIPPRDAAPLYAEPPAVRLPA